MAQRQKTGKKAAKTASRKPARKIAKKKAAKKKSSLKKKTLKKKLLKKKATTKKAAKKKTVKKAVKKRTSRAAAASVPPKPLMVEPGPPPRTVPPVEEPAPNEEAIGVITHYYSHLGVAVVQINKGSLKTGETVRIKGHSTDFTQTVDSMEYEHQHVTEAVAGQSIGMKVKDHTREHDILFRVH